MFAFQNGVLSGYNTDAYGFEKSLKSFYLDNGTALVLGNGGSSRAVQYVLSKNNIPFKVVSRSGTLNYKNNPCQSPERRKPDYQYYSPRNVSYDRYLSEHSL